MTLAKERIDELGQRVPRLELDLPDPFPDGAVIELDGEILPARRHRESLALDPGPHRVVLLVPNHQPQGEDVELSEGQRLRLTLSVGPEEPRPEPMIVPIAAEGLGDVQIAGLVVGALGVLSVTAGAITGGLVLDRKATVERLCIDDVCSDPAGIEAAQSGHDLATASTVTFAVGGAALAAGIIMLIVGEPERSETGLVVVSRW